jgi:hypothetical protein
VRCAKCGNENSGTNRFCGMCGAPQATATEAAKTEAAKTHAPAPFAADTTAEHRASSAVAPDLRRKAQPVISGPSFLGLSTPGPAHSTSHDSSSGNLDYLLDDEEEPPSGHGKLILIVVALALVLGFGYLRWRQGGFDWLNAANKKPAPAADASHNDVPQTPDSGSATSPPAADNSASQSSANNTTPAPNNAAAPADSAATQSTPSQTNSQAATSPNNTTQDASQNVPQNPGDANPPAASTSPADSESPAETTPASPQPKAKIDKKERKPAPAKPAAGQYFDSVAEAERYIYGRGARQDCDHGVRLLKTTAQQSNPKAMISLGALYSTGTCTPRDLPTAYRWFALALHKQPDNQVLQDDLKSLWDKMTPPERQLAIKLSQ